MDPQPRSRTYLRQILSSRIAIIILLLAFLLLTALFSLPYGIDYGIRDWLASQGASYVKIDDIDFNPFSGKLRVKNLRTGRGDAPHVRIGEASLTITWRPMFENRFYFDEITIRDSLLTIRQKADGQLVIGGLKARPSRNKPGDKTAGFGAGRIAILNSKLGYQTEELELNAAIKSAVIGALSSWQPDKATPLEFSGQLENGQADFAGEMKPFAAQASLAGTLKTSGLSLAPVNALPETKNFTVDGTVDADVHIKLALTNTSKNPAGRSRYDITGNVTLNDLGISGKDKQTALWNTKTIQIKGIEVKPQQVSGKDTAATAADSPSHIAIQSVNLDTMNTSLHRDTNGRWLVIDDILESTVAEADKAPAQLTFSIDEVTVGGDSAIQFQDDVVKPVFQKNLAIDRFHVLRIDSRHPEQASEMELTGKIGEYTDVSLDGNMQLFSEKLNLVTQGKIGNLDMPPLSPYTEHYLGYVINSGHMNVDLETKVTNDEIDASYHLKAGNPQVTIVDQDKSQPLSKTLNMPLESALNLLRDKNKDVELKIAVTGNIHDPDFDYSDAINQAIGKAVRTAALGYLKFTLGPFGALITLGQLAGEAAAHVGLEPLKFAAGQAAFDAIDIDYLQRIAGLLEKRPALRIRVCGTAVATDLTALRKEKPGTDQTEALQLLAKTRAENVKNHLISKYAIDPERLFICLPEVIPASDAPPQVKLML